MGTLNFICDFGNSHPIIQSCGCAWKYKIPVGLFRYRLHQTFGTWEKETFRGKERLVMNKPIYAHEITQRMRDETISKINGSPPEGELERLQSRKLA